MMKKLHLLKPNIVKGYLGGGNGDRFRCLQIEDTLGYDELKEDVENGAFQFEDCLKNADGKLSRVVVVRGRSEEDVLMAVNYLAAVANQQELEEESQNEDYYDMDPDYSEEINHWDYSMMENEEEWEESPYRVPIVSLSEIAMYENNAVVFHGMNNLAFSGMSDVKNKTPYWRSCRKEMICVMVGYRMEFGIMNFENLTAQLERFANNRHLFIAYVDPWMKMSNGEKADDFEEEEYDREGLFSFVVENTADMIVAWRRDEKLKKYRRLQFDNWALQLGIDLDRNVPRNEIVDKILKMNNGNKSEMMKNILLYVQKESRKKSGESVTKADFAILSKFFILSSEKDEKKSLQRLENELVGMEDVKQQVKGIVNVMQYCKVREKMGFGRGTYHNVHLLIGAPGTAKSTVATLMGNMMREEGLLPGNRMACVNGAELKGMYVGHSEPKTKQLFEDNDIILIDEAYSLVDGNDESDSFSREAIAQMLLEIEEHPTDKLILFAGYGGKEVSEKDNKMKQFLDANPGLKSRINSTIYFDSYSPDEMIEIVHRQAKNQHFVVDKKANESIRKYFAKRCKSPDFGNGREARSLLENAMVFAANRLMTLPESKRTKKALCLLTEEDMSGAIARMQESNRMQEGKVGKCGFMKDIA